MYVAVRMHKLAQQRGVREACGLKIKAQEERSVCIEYLVMLVKVIEQARKNYISESMLINLCNDMKFVGLFGSPHTAVIVAVSFTHLRHLSIHTPNYCIPLL